MSLTTDLLAVMLNREAFYEVTPYLKQDERIAVFTEMDKKLLNILYKLYKHTSIINVSRNDLLTFYKLNNKDSEEDQAIMNAMIKYVARMDINDIPQSSFLVQKIAEQALGYHTSVLINDYNNGKEVDLLGGINALNEKYRRYTQGMVNTSEVSLDIAHLLGRKLDGTGFSWHIEALNKNLVSLYEGTFVLVCARPEVGKTTFLTQLVTHFAPQIDKVYPDEERVIVWCNTEGIGSEIQARLYQSALRSGLTKLGEHAKAGVLYQKYVDALGGRVNIKVYDVHGYNSNQIEAILRKDKPALTVFDMLDHIQYVGASANSTDKSHEKLEGLYQWAREVGVKFGCAIIATSQLSADAEGVSCPTQDMLAGSKTGKAGAADIIMMVGKGENPTHPELRTISTPKNKRAKEGRPVNGQFNAALYPHEGYYE